MTSHEVFTTNANPWHPGPAWLAQEYLDNCGNPRRTLSRAHPDSPRGELVESGDLSGR